jgi:dihydrofolate reductase
VRLVTSWQTTADDVTEAGARFREAVLAQASERHWPLVWESIPAEGVPDCSGRAWMSTVVMHAVVSVDGYIADEHDEVGPLFDWYFNGDRSLFSGTEDSVHLNMSISERSHGYVKPFWDSIGCAVVGRHLFDLTNGWEAKPPACDHLVVVSHRPKPNGWHPEADVPFVDDVPKAIETARALAGDGVVALSAGNVAGQALALGLVDAVAMDVVPVVFGSGKRYFGRVDGQHMLEDPDVVMQGDRVLHLRYPVRQ